MGTLTADYVFVPLSPQCTVFVFGSGIWTIPTQRAGEMGSISGYRLFVAGSTFLRLFLSSLVGAFTAAKMGRFLLLAQELEINRMML